MTHLLAPGRFTEALRTAPAELVTAPLADHPAVADLVVRRYRHAARDALWAAGAEGPGPARVACRTARPAA
ncbi:hypothetical protein G3I40_31140 [Streptomyces sp. SID14478]|nr:hypothetical protein [Streptomyces sp. SID14478]